MYREVSVIEVRELLRVWMSGAGLRRVGALAGVDRKTARDYTNAAELAGLVRDGDLDQLTDELIGVVIEAVRPGRSRWPRCDVGVVARQPRSDRQVGRKGTDGSQDL